MKPLKHVRYVGKNPMIRVGAKGVMREDGRVQLDGPKDMWRADPAHYDPRCFGWWNLGTEWEEVSDATM